MKRGLLRDERFLMVVIVLIAAVVRVAFLMLPRVVRWDEAAHQLIAHSLLAGRGFSELAGARDVQQGPLVSYLSLPGVWLRWPVPWATAGIAYVLFGSLLPAPLYGLGRELYGRRIGLIAALLAAVYPALVAGPLYWGTMTEPPFLFLVVSGIYCVYRAAVSLSRGDRFSRSACWGVGVAVALGLAYLDRPEALAYLAVMLLYLLLAGATRPANSLPRGWPAWRWAHALPVVVLAALTFLVVTLPYDIYIYRVTGSWAISGKQGLAANIAQAVTAGNAAEIDRSGAALDSTGREIMWLSLEQFNSNMTDAIRANPWPFIQHVRHNVGEMWQALFHRDLFSSWALALIALGLFARPWTCGRLARELLLFLTLAPLVSILAFFVISRLLVIAIPIALLWMAGGLAHLAVWTQVSFGLAGGESVLSGGLQPTTHSPALPDTASGAARGGRPSKRAARGGFTSIARALPLALTIGAFLGISGDLAHRELAIQPFWRIEVASWLAGHVPAGSPIMVRDSEVALYAGLPMVAFPSAEWPQVLAYGQARNADYLVVEEQMIEDLRPQLSGLLDTAHRLPGVSLLAELPGPAASKTLVFAFEAAP